MARPKGYSPLFGRVLSPQEMAAYRAGKLQPPARRPKPKSVARASGGVGKRQQNALIKQALAKFEKSLEERVLQGVAKVLAGARVQVAVNIVPGKKRGRPVATQKSAT